MSHFFAYLARMKFIKRWGLMHNTYAENVQEHSLWVAQIAHALALIRNRLFEGDVDPNRVTVLALYHDASEVLTGDLPSPIKYFNPEIQKAYKTIEASAAETLVAMVPEAIAEDYRTVLLPEDRRTHRYRQGSGQTLRLYQVPGGDRRGQQRVLSSRAVAPRDRRRDRSTRSHLLHGNLRAELPFDAR